MGWLRLALVVCVAGAAAGGEPAVLRDDVNVVPAGQWRYDLFVLKDQLPANVACVYTVAKPGRASLELLTKESLEALVRGEAYEPITTSRSGELQQEIGVPGQYAVVIRNLDKDREARVALRLTLDFPGLPPGRPIVHPRYLSQTRRLAVILISFFGFLTVITLCARKVLLAMRR